MTLDGLKKYYATVFWQTFSLDGKYLIVSLKSGKIAIFQLDDILRKLNDESFIQIKPLLLQPFYSTQVCKSSIYGFQIKYDFLITGAQGKINILSWKKLLRNESSLDMTLEIPTEENLVRPDVNAIAVPPDDSDSSVFVACGNNIYIFDLETNKTKAVLKGHTDYINCLAYSTNRLFSGSEDGSVRIWDLRSSKMSEILEPYKDQELNRPLGKWIGSIALDSSFEWMVCGGGPSLSSWHLRTLSRGVNYDSCSEISSNIAIIYNEFVISGGNNSLIRVWNLNGKAYSEINADASNIYSIAISPNEKPIMAIAGTSHKINICSNFQFTDFQLEVD